MNTSSLGPDPVPASPLQKAAGAWNRFWFRPADPLPLGVIRFFTGVVILYVHLIYSLNLLEFVGPDGWANLDKGIKGQPETYGPMEYVRNHAEYYMSATNWTNFPTEPYARGMPIWSVYFHLTDPGWIVFTHCAFLVAMVMFTAGFATRLTTPLSWFATLCYVHRCPTLLYGMDTIMNVLLFYLMFAPCGATFSVDRLLAKWWARRHGREPAPVQPLVSANFVLRLMQVHFCFIYMASGLSKLQGTSWWNGTAVWGCMANYSFAPMNWPLYVEFLRFLAEHRWLWEIIMTGGSWGTLVIEISFPFLIWRPRWRWLMICLSVALHTGIGIVMGLTTFSLLMLCLVLAFVPASTHHRLVGIMRQQLADLTGSMRGGGTAARAAERSLAARA